MSSKQKISKAFNATRSLGIPDGQIKPILKDLLKMYDGNWKLIEEDNYRTLVDAYFEHNESEGLEGNKGRLVEDKKSLIPLKRSRDGEQSNRASSITGSSGRKLIVRKDKISEVDLGHKTTNSSQGSQQGLVIRPSEMLSSVKPVSVVFPDKKALTNGNMGCKSHQKGSSSSQCARSLNTALFRDQCTSNSSKRSTSSEHVRPISRDQHNRKNTNSSLHHMHDLTKGAEKVKISWVNELGNESIPKFNYIPNNLIFQNASVNISLARISEDDCCSSCSGDCLLSSYPCACARETGGEFAYTREGLLKEEFLNQCMSMRCEPNKEHLFYCEDCPIERLKNGYKPDRCKGHLLRKFIKECWGKCGCDMQCGNRVVQRGISCKLQVYFTCEGKGWGLRTLKNLPKGSFVCEYVGEVLTNTELYDRNMQSTGNERHTYPVTLDADWGSEGVLEDDELLCLDATYYGNVARFINHRCSDANLIDIPVEVETPDRHYYHLAFFTSREVKALEELTWDYAIDFDDKDHPVKAFKCCCGSAFCRDAKKKHKKALP
ncbi:histone-lysine N-methyltransferase SUVR4-like [Cucurbita moschata]|uniref:Histone-lysine N-methyltransferase SUVR4-like n=1 Tax=Cucurbita moschata TaxID=3662 RepID=A0A6J1EN65_CUCMO|nr:histone-lysine N-methyltransferase SUVR4-like [Cucurbita moschata]XP_022929592.1 histone-lysine N-methyltransferase SUVR4-like [Cucurbita moschata]XP_022929593.1 histone-lysine N-methyltransferase SUVR4-like [Cucurbita moschata]